MFAPRTIRATLAERFIFNFRLPLAALARRLPAPWLAPLPVNGYAVASFCLLDLRHITLAPLPTVAGCSSISCAARYGVLDLSHNPPQPAVYVPARNTNSAFGAWATALSFSAPHPYLATTIAHGQGSQAAIEVGCQTLEPLFGATVAAAETFQPGLFASVDEFAGFIADGVASYAISRYPRQLASIDLHKDATAYVPLAVSGLRGSLVEQWRAEGAVFDSAFRTSGGRYAWTYRGLADIGEPRAVVRQFRRGWQPGAPRAAA